MNDNRKQNGKKAAKKFAAFPLVLAIAAFVAVVIYLVVGSPGTPI